MSGFLNIANIISVFKTLLYIFSFPLAEVDDGLEAGLFLRTQPRPVRCAHRTLLLLASARSTCLALGAGTPVPRRPRLEYEQNSISILKSHFYIKIYNTHAYKSPCISRILKAIIKVVRIVFYIISSFYSRNISILFLFNLYYLIVYFILIHWLMPR